MLGFRNNFKKGMTLGELLMVFIIMGIVAAMTIIAAKPMDKSIKYSYLKTYNTLSTAFFNAMQNIPDSFDKTRMDGDFPKYSKEFCLMLLEYINTSNGSATVNCSQAPINIGGNKNYLAVDALLNTYAPNFIASNGVKYWIASINSTDTGYEHASFHSTADTVKPDSTFTVKYYIVIADLNGDMPPNTTYWSPAAVADRVAFAVTDSAEVLPMGAAEFDNRYLNAQVVYAQAGGVDIEAQNTSKPVSYYEAKRMAWGVPKGDNVSGLDEGFYVSPDNPMSIHPYKGLYNKSPFYFDYHWARYCAPIKNGTNCFVQDFRDWLDLSYKDNTEGTCKSEFVNTEGGTEERFDPDACYVKIPDYN